MILNSYVRHSDLCWDYTIHTLKHIGMPKSSIVVDEEGGRERERDRERER